MTRKQPTRSRPHRTTTSSGGSEKSTTTGTSRPSKNSSATPPASFEQVFGPERSEEAKKADKQITEAVERLAAHERTPEPTNTLLRLKWTQRRARLRRHVALLQEYRETLD